MRLPQPSSRGRYSHGIPVLRTNRIPVTAAQSSMRGRAPFGDGFILNIELIVVSEKLEIEMNHDCPKFGSLPSVRFWPIAV